MIDRLLERYRLAAGKNLVALSDGLMC